MIKKVFGLLAVASAVACFTAAAGLTVKVLTDDGSGTYCTPLIAGQNMDIGDVCVTADNEFVYISYEIDETNDWFIKETHLWAGQSIADMPQNRAGNPKIGQFPYGDSGMETKAWAVQIPLVSLGLTVDDICLEDQIVLFAAHAAVCRIVDGEVVQGETAWGEGEPITDRGSWAMFDSFTLTCEDNNGGGPEDCETAFAFGDTELDDLEDPFNPGNPLTNRWGWQITTDIGGYLPTGQKEWVATPVYAGAGQNDITKGTHVGNFVYHYDGESFVGKFRIFPEFELVEAHLYAENESTFTAAPGQFTRNGYQTTFTDYGAIYRVDNAYDGGLLYIVAHAVVCERVNE
jgi:hypothetical protein